MRTTEELIKRIAEIVDAAYNAENEVIDGIDVNKTMLKVNILALVNTSCLDAVKFHGVERMKSALEDIVNWNDDLEMEYDDPGQRAMIGLGIVE